MNYRAAIARVAASVAIAAASSVSTAHASSIAFQPTDPVSQTRELPLTQPKTIPLNQPRQSVLTEPRDTLLTQPLNSSVTKQLDPSAAAELAIDQFASANPWLGPKVNDLQSGPNGGFWQSFQGFPNPNPPAQTGANTAGTSRIANAIGFDGSAGGAPLSRNGAVAVAFGGGNNSVPAVPNDPLAPVALAAVFDDLGQVHAVHGDILTNYMFHVAGPGGPLGYPLTDESGTPDGIGRFNHFQGGSIYLTPNTGAHEVHGAIYDKWASLGWEKSVVGYPLTDEGGTPDGVGRFNHFQYGSIYWTPATGAVEVHGAIYDRWASLGWEKSYLGYPVMDEHDCGDGARCSTFQHGWIRWTAADGAVDTSGVYYVHLDSFNVINPRSQFNDSDYAAFTAKAPNFSGGTNNTTGWGPQNLGKNTNEPTGLTLGPYTIPPDSADQLGFSYIIDNYGGEISSEAMYTRLGGIGLSLAGEAIGTLFGPGGSTTGKEIGSEFGTTLNDLSRQFLNDLNGILAPITSFVFADCDGVVAQDEIAYTGAALAVDTAGGAHSETHTYPGSDSPAGCGSNSIYTVTWSISRG